MLTDHWLPEMSGLELIERLLAHSSTSHIPAVLVSGMLLDGGTTQPDGVLTKPLDLEALLTHVERVLDLGDRAAAGG